MSEQAKKSIRSWATAVGSGAVVALLVYIASTLSSIDTRLSVSDERQRSQRALIEKAVEVQDRSVERIEDIDKRLRVIEDRSERGE